jgi:hypothetical protein
MKKPLGPLSFALLAATMLAAPIAVAQPPGNWSVTIEDLHTSSVDLKDGFGIADPYQNNPCTYLIPGLRVSQPLRGTWEVDQNMGTNLNGPGAGVDQFLPGLGPVPGSNFTASRGYNLGIPCPLPGSPFPPANLWLVWSGMNWRSAEAASSARLSLCSQKTFPSSSPGCLAVPDSQNRLWASACNWNEANFGADYDDGKGKYLGGAPFDALGFKSDQIKCNSKPHGPVNQGNTAWKGTRDYTNTIQDFSSGGASQTFDLIKNEAVVPNGFGPAYMAVCWDMQYLDFSKNDPVTGFPPLRVRALTHDWKLILDVGLGGKKQGGVSELVDALQAHYGGQQVGDQYSPFPNVAMRGFYSQDSGNPKGTDFKTGATGVVGENGFPCKGPATLPAAKKCVTTPQTPVCIT